jgi:Linalool dehydratase/isomerase
MVYAAGAVHYHRLPAMRSMFKALPERLIAKMLHGEVWGYWYLTSQSGIRTDPDLKETRKPWADPVCKENIMVNIPL